MLHYQLEFDDYTRHLIRVTLRMVAAPRQQLWLPTWIPGSYLIREFARHIEQVQAFDEQGRPLKISKISKNRWELFNTDHELISIEYVVYAFDLSVRGSYVDQTRLYVNPAAVCLAVEGQEEAGHELELFIPAPLQHLDYAGALPARSQVKGRYTLGARHYQELIDSPFELAVQQRITFEAAGISHEWVVSGIHQTDLQRIARDLGKICEAQIQLFGSAPFERYTFMTMATGQLYGGLEHQSSTSLLTPRDDLPSVDEPAQPSTGYQRYLGLCSHEYFHAWLVKCIRPANFLTPDLNQEGYTPLLWLFEGVTSYYDDLMLRRAGLISDDDYLKLLSDQINRYLQNPGQRLQSLAESSFDAWIKFYRPDENTANAGTSYYNKGALAALCLDGLLHEHGHSLDDVVRQLYALAQQGEGVTEQTLPQLLQQLTGEDWTNVLDHLIYSTAELPLADALALLGVQFEKKSGQPVPFGAKITEKPEGLMVQSVLRDSAAAKGGLSAQDQIVALDGLRASQTVWQRLSQTSRQSITCHVFRRDELMQLTLDIEQYAVAECQLLIQDHDLAKRWLSGAAEHSPQ